MQQTTQKKLHHHTIILAKHRGRFFEGIIASVVGFWGGASCQKGCPLYKLEPWCSKSWENFVQRLQLVIKRVSGKQPPWEDTFEAGVVSRFSFFKLGLYTYGCSSKKNGLEKCTTWNIMTCIFMRFNIMCVKYCEITAGKSRQWLKQFRFTNWNSYITCQIDPNCSMLPIQQKEPPESFDPHQSVHSTKLTWLLKTLATLYWRRSLSFCVSAY